MMKTQSKIDAIRAYQLSDYIWDKEKKYYIYPNGKKVPEGHLFGAIRRFQAKLNDDLQSVTTAMLSGDIDLAGWQKRISSRVRNAHFELMRFGMGPGNSRAWHEAKIEKRLRSIDYPALQRFAEDLQSGKLSEKQIRSRIELYAMATKSSYEMGRIEIKKTTGQRFGRRLLGRTDIHCEDCIEYALRGWQRIEDIILPGVDCQCGSRCLCSIETSDRIP